MSGAGPAVSVVVCAYTQRRWGDLQDAVDSVIAQSVPAEVIVVIDHEPELLAMASERWASTRESDAHDAAAAGVAAHDAAAPGVAAHDAAAAVRTSTTVRVLPNDGPQGLSGGRNTGMAAASGEVVAFLDDDATAEPGWLARLVEPFVDDDVIAVGGTAVPVWPEGARADLYPPELLWIVGCSHRGLPETMTEVRNVIGCSMAFRLAPVLAAGGFDIDTGRVGAVPLGCEETELCIRLRQQNPAAKILLDPEAVVLHRVSADRATWSYVRSRGYHEGISKAILGRKLGRGDALSSETAYAKQVLPAAVLRELTQVGRGGATRIGAIGLMTVSTIVGFLRAARATPKPAAGVTPIPAHAPEAVTR